MHRNYFRFKSNVIIPSVWEEVMPSIGTGLGIALLLYFADPPLWLVPVVAVALFAGLSAAMSMIGGRRSKHQ
jgi:predicted Na+-dependent transporter